jgi:hypothetical protein
LPSQTFFRFCEELLEKYRDDERIMSIAGMNLLPQKYIDNSCSYWFSNDVHIWGWATWRRSWRKFKLHSESYLKFIESEKFKKYFNSFAKYDYLKNAMLEQYGAGKKQTAWGYSWYLSNLLNNGLTIVPNRNLTMNIGFENEFTHTNRPTAYYSKLKLENIQFPLRHPSIIEGNKLNDNAYFLKQNFTTLGLIKKSVKKLISIFQEKG